MLRFISILVLFAQAFVIKAQSDDTTRCDCASDFVFVTNYLENHYSGFDVNVTVENRSRYELLKSKIGQFAASTEQEGECLLLIRQYLDFFRDNHLQIAGRSNNQRIEETKAEDVEAFKSGVVFKSRERVSFDSTQFVSYLQKSPDDIEGIYEGEVYTVAVVKDSLSSFRDYYGVMIRSTSLLWERGQIKFDLQLVDGTDRANAILYLRNHSISVRTLSRHNVVENLLSVKKVLSENTVGLSRFSTLTPGGAWFQFKEVNDSTTYLHIKTFDGSLKSKFDSAYKVVLPLIQQKPNLIIDIRNNGGGSDYCWQALARLFYTTPYPTSETEYFCSSEIIKRNEERLAEMRKNPKAYGKGFVKYSKIRLNRMKRWTPGTFMPFAKTIPWYVRPFFVSSTVSQRRVYDSPSRVLLIYNRNSASAAEGLILAALQSKKVITFGENSGGYIAFGDIRITTTPSGLRLQSATQRTLSRWKYEMSGIPPAIRANPDSDWIEQGVQILNTHRAVN